MIYKCISFTAVAFLVFVGGAAAEGPGICDVHPNRVCTPGMLQLLALPEGDCPLPYCSTKLTPAQLECEAGLCQVYPQPFGNTLLAYQWSVSNASIAASAHGPELFYSCGQNTNALVRVTITTTSGAQSVGQQLIFCRRPSVGTLPQ